MIIRHLDKLRNGGIVKHMKKRVIIAIPALLIMLNSINIFGEELDDTKNKLNDVKNSISEKKEMIEAIEKNEESVKSQIDSIDIKMNNISGELSNLKKQITKSNEDITVLNNEIDEKKKKLEEETVLMGKRINSIYKSGTSGYLSIVLGSKDLSELVERVVFVKSIIEYDKNLIGQINKEKEVIESKKLEVSKKRNELQAARVKMDSRYSDLKEQSEEKESLVRNFEKDKEKYQSMLEQEEADAKELQNKIKKLQTKFQTPSGKLVSVTGKRYPITSNYGLRMHPVLGYARFHDGIDIGVPMGTPIYSLNDGIVVYSGTMSGYGNVIMINHGDIISLYAHNSNLVAQEGQTIKSGQLIAYSGNSGVSSGPHLHFEIRTSNGNTIDPTTYYK